MKLKILRNQKSGRISTKISFTLDAKAELTEQEAGHIKRYKMGKEILYSNIKVEKGQGPGIIEAIKGGLLGILSATAGATTAAVMSKALDITVTVNDLVKGKHIECKDIFEVIAAEEQIKEACAVFKEILETAANFGGEEILEF